jgi:hypothetical protein
MNNNTRALIVFILVAGVIGVLMGIRANAPFDWQRALIAGVAFAFLGWLVSYVLARRRRS